MSKKDYQNLTPNLEDYLEAIYNIEQKYNAARVRDIASRLNVRAASVTGALKSLSEKGFINYTPYQYITLTKRGKIQAREIAQKHKLIKRFFIDVLAIDEEVADYGACGTEHRIPKVIIDRMVDFTNFSKQTKFKIVLDEFKESLSK